MEKNRAGERTAQQAVEEPVPAISLLTSLYSRGSQKRPGVEHGP